MSSMMRRSSELLEVARRFREGNSVTDAAIRQFLTALDTPRALTVYLLYKNGEHDQLTALDIDPRWYNCRFRFRDDYVATNYLSKASFLKTTFDREKVALAKFHEYEALCGLTNSRFRNLSLDPLYNGSNVWLLHATKRKILEILGDFDAEEFVDGANWGPGVTTRLKGSEVSAFNKFHAERGMTRDLYSLVSPWFAKAYPSLAINVSEGNTRPDGGFVFEVGNEIITVPKNSKTDRVIAIEPGWNLWFQKSIGTMIRRRLLRAGVDLNSQEVNQRLARVGSLDSSLATVDFSSASDSISRELVRELLPPRWYTLLDSCRCHIGVLASGPIRWNKFSSMGNGFTFELESLIFYAAACAAVEYSAAELAAKGETPDKKTAFWINVFGDDVILPSHAYELFSSFSAFLGFRVNPKKSFSLGFFRESCGSHFFDGLNCKPVYLKDRIRYVEDFFKLANGIRHLAHRYGFGRYCDVRFLDSWRHLYERVPEPLRFKVPTSAGDVGFISNFDEASPARARGGIEGFFYRALTTSAVQRKSDSWAMLMVRLWSQSQLEYGNTYTLRGRSKRALTNSLVARWYNLGPWW